MEMGREIRVDREIADGQHEEIIISDQKQEQRHSRHAKATIQGSIDVLTRCWDEQTVTDEATGSMRCDAIR